jgi:hypothetical protein
MGLRAPAKCLDSRQPRTGLALRQYEFGGQVTSKTARVRIDQFRFGERLRSFEKLGALLAHWF